MRVSVFFVLLAWGAPALADTATVVEGARVNLRSGKYDTYRVLRALEPGTVVEVLNQEKSYVQVKTTEGEVGWLPLRLVKIAVPPSLPTVAEPEVKKAEIIQAPPTDIKQPLDAPAPTSIWLLLGIGSAGLVAGALLGAGAVLVHYRKKLNGLRI